VAEFNLLRRVGHLPTPDVRIDVGAAGIGASILRLYDSI
jgi:hypothetical protein